MKKIFIRPKASLDLDEQALFIAKDNLQAAYRFYGSCDDTLKGLAKMPQMGQRYPTEKKQLAGIRFLPIQGFERHLIFYIPAKDRIDVVRILYATRDIRKIFQKTSWRSLLDSLDKFSGDFMTDRNRPPHSDVRKSLD